MRQAILRHNSVSGQKMGEALSEQGSRGFWAVMTQRMELHPLVNTRVLTTCRRCMFQAHAPACCPTSPIWCSLLHVRPPSRPPSAAPLPPAALLERTELELPMFCRKRNSCGHRDARGSEGLHVIVNSRRHNTACSSGHGLGQPDDQGMSVHILCRMCMQVSCCMA